MTQMNLIEDFGINQFGKVMMRERLPQFVYEAWEQAIYENIPINREIADAISESMKEWAIERGATHFCHWFQPLTGKTAEKHTSFLREDQNGLPIARLSGKSLMRGETDGSSFPNGGLRDTFEARGYTYWDLSSYAFVRENVLYIPSVYVSYTGAKLDMKMPLINAREALSREATRMLNLLGRTEVKFVRPMIGLEQEYYLVYQDKALQRPDLRYCERTLFSAEMPRNGDYEAPYFSSVSEKVKAFMHEVNQECWKVGMYLITEHNEASPGQYEFVTMYNEATTTIDQNMLLMDILKKVALRHGFLCLLTEKPFAKLSGSGKHNNISLIDSTGVNVFEPGEKAHEDLQFIVFLTAFIEAVDKYQVLLRMASSNEGNDHRLGGFEAPPSVLSIHLGDKLHDLFMELSESTAITEVELKQVTAPLANLAAQSIDATDRNRTAPISFSGNKFEIRTLGASINASSLNAFLFAAMAESLQDMADKLEASPRANAEELHKSVMKITHDIMKDHYPILFNGNGYDQKWQEEAANRGLKKIDHYIDTVEILRDPDSIQLLSKFNVLNEEEMEARYQVLVRDYIHSVKTQARIITRMAQEGIYPALLKYQIDLEKVALNEFSKSAKVRAKFNADLMDQLDQKTKELDQLIGRITAPDDKQLVIQGMLHQLIPAMNQLSALLWKIELYSPYNIFPYATQEDLIVV